MYRQGLSGVAARLANLRRRLLDADQRGFGSFRPEGAVRGRALVAHELAALLLPPGAPAPVRHNNLGEAVGDARHPARARLRGRRDQPRAPPLPAARPLRPLRRRAAELHPDRGGARPRLHQGRAPRHRALARQQRRGARPRGGAARPPRRRARQPQVHRHQPGDRGRRLCDAARQRLRLRDLRLRRQAGVPGAEPGGGRLPLPRGQGLRRGAPPLPLDRQPGLRAQGPRPGARGLRADARIPSDGLRPARRGAGLRRRLPPRALRDPEHRDPRLGRHREPGLRRPARAHRRARLPLGRRGLLRHRRQQHAGRADPAGQPRVGRRRRRGLRHDRRRHGRGGRGGGAGPRGAAAGRARGDGARRLDGGARHLHPRDTTARRSARRSSGSSPSTRLRASPASCRMPDAGRGRGRPAGAARGAEPADAGARARRPVDPRHGASRRRGALGEQPRSARSGGSSSSTRRCPAARTSPRAGARRWRASRAPVESLRLAETAAFGAAAWPEPARDRRGAGGRRRPRRRCPASTPPPTAPASPG